MCEDGWDDVVLFTCVRNPWDRVLSAFVSCQALYGKTKGQEYLIDPEWTFHDWIMQKLCVEGFSINKHFIEQTHSFMCDGAMIPKIFIARYERLGRDWETLAGILGATVVKPRRLNPSRHEPYTHYYDSDTIDAVARLYRTEIDILGYEYGYG
jgi:hypothetical protein